MKAKKMAIKDIPWRTNRQLAYTSIRQGQVSPILSLWDKLLVPCLMLPTRLEGQHRHRLVSVPSSYSPYDDCFGHYEHYVQPPAPPILPSSSTSELGYTLVETPP